jgi:poly(3-hydroxybutyrate) depolymerase
MRHLLVFLLLVTLAPAAGATLAPGDSDRPLVFGGLDRHYLVHVPLSYDAATAVPLVLDFRASRGPGGAHGAPSERL